MAFGFDHSIILSARQTDPNETMRTFAQLANARQQREEGQMRLSALLRDRERDATLADIYKQHAGAPEALPTALLRGGFGQQAFAAQDQSAQLARQQAEVQRAQAEFQREQEKRIGDLFYGVKDQKTWASARAQVPEAFRAKIPETFDPTAAQQLAALAVPAEKRAQFDASAAEAEKRRAFERGENEKERSSRAAAEKEKSEAKAKDDVAKGATDLRKELQLLPESKDFRSVTTAYAGVKDSVKDPSGSGGIATIFNFMKMLDPGVAVMEGDVQLIKSSGGPAAQYANLYQQALTGNPLPAKVLKEIEARADSLYAIRQKQYQKVADRYGALAEKRGIPREEVVLDFGLQAPTAGGLPPDREKRRQELRKLLGKEAP